MKIKKADIYTLKIPFKDTFQHSLKKRVTSDSLVVRLVSESGVYGYGEGIPRPYVTGETLSKSVAFMKAVLLPAIMEKDWDCLDSNQAFSDILEGILEPSNYQVGNTVYYAARTAVELALFDCLLKTKDESLACLLPPRRDSVVYSGVISAGGGASQAKKRALQAKGLGLSYLKIKVGEKDDVQRIAAIREIMGPTVSLRLDANGAFDVQTAITFINRVQAFDIDVFEQPIPAENVIDLASVRHHSTIPIMADESLVTLIDAEELIQAQACDYFNLRLSKNGGLFNTLQLAKLAREAGIGLQLGCQVGESAILSAVGRHIAAHIEEVEFVEGSYGEFLLNEDIVETSIQFGSGGHAELLPGAGLGVNVCPDRLEKYATSIESEGVEL